MSDAEKDDPAAEVVGRCRERMERGERVDVEAVAREHPDLAPRLRRLLGGLRRVERAFAPSHADVAARPDRNGRLVGPYRLLRELGAGGMGTVWLATTEGVAPGVRVAVKLLHPHLAARAGFVERFLREAEIGRRIRHPNVVRTLDAGEDAAEGERLRFVAMEYVEGRTLRALLADLGRVPEELCRHIGREVAEALAAVHAAGAVHRDLKPENVLITQDHVVKVMDLGVARLLDDAARLSQTGAFVGSLRYAAPEQFGLRSASGAAGPATGDGVDPRADLHALGLLLYELATGTHPFDADEVGAVVRRVLDERPRRAGELNPQLSPFFEELLAQLLEKDRNLRPGSAGDVARVLAEGEESAWWRERSRAIREATHRPLRRIRIPRETALYGREAELSLLRSVFERASKGDGQVLLLEGEAGIGKSRLVDEFVGALAQAGEDVDFLSGSYPPGGAATASGAFSTAYREHLGGDDDAIRAALPQTPLLVPAFAALLRGDGAPEGAEKLTKDSLQTVFVHATRAFAAARPTIVLIDDLHFAPEEGRALFASLALAVPGHRILLVGCTRPGLDEGWTAQLASRPQTTRLVLPRLGPKELVHLLRDALKSERLAEELGVLIAVKSDGNPYFVFELLRGLREGQFLRQRPDGAWETTQVIRDIQVPSSISELVQARVADLDPEDKNLLDVAACCGFEFDPLVVAAALGVPPVPAMQRLARIEKRHRLVRSAGRRFVFDHHQVEEALYAGMPEPLREAYHAAIAEAIEARHGAASRDPKDVEGAVCVELAEHFLEGAKGERALRYLDAAMTHLERSYLNGAAVRLASRVLDGRRLVDDGTRCELLLRAAQRLAILGRHEEQRPRLDEAVLLADAAGDASIQARVRAELGWSLNRLGGDSAAEQALRDAIRLAASAKDSRIEALARNSLGGVLRNDARYAEAMQMHEDQLALANSIGDGRLAALAIGNIGNILSDQGRYVEARSSYERALVLARGGSDPRAEAAITGNLGRTLLTLGQIAESQALHERNLALARQIGDRHGEAAAVRDLGVVYFTLGWYAKALANYERHLALALEMGDRRGEATALHNLGKIRHDLGRQDDAQSHAERSLALVRDIVFPWGEGFVLQALADLAAERCETSEAERLSDEALARHRAVGNRTGAATSLLARGELFAAAGRAADARAVFLEAKTIMTEAAVPDETVVAEALLAQLPGGDAAAAVSALAEHGGKLATSQAMKAHYVVWLVNRELPHLAEARRLLDHLVAHAPPECRESMLANVRLHREIAAAARERGVV